MSRLPVPGAALALVLCTSPATRAQCDTIRFQHYDGAGMVVPTEPAPLNGEGFGIVVDGLPPEHFPLELTRVGFAVANASIVVDVEVYDTWPQPQFFPVPTWVHPGVTATAGPNEFDVTPSGPIVLAAQPFVVVARNRTGGSTLGVVHDGNGCAGGADTSVWHYVFVPPGWFSYCPTGDGDWVFWIEYRPAAVGTPMCLGDGSEGDCPCGAAQNGPPGAGCLHSFGDGGVMQAWGKAQVSDDTLALHVSGLPANTIALYFQYATATTPFPFGDGLMCVGGPVVRLNGTLTQNGASCVGPTSQPVSVLGQIPAAGGTRHYQAWYRNAVAAWCTPDRFNLTSGLRIDWVP